jgi:hypothetical protein
MLLVQARVNAPLQHFQVLRVVVLFIAIFVVNNLGVFQWTTK